MALVAQNNAKRALDSGFTSLLGNPEVTVAILQKGISYKECPVPGGIRLSGPLPARWANSATRR